MKTFILLFALLVGSQMVQAQKIKIKGDIVTVDGEAYLKWVNTEGTSGANVYLPNSSEEVVTILHRSYTEASKDNEKVSWIEIQFLSLDLICEVEVCEHKELVQMFYDNNVFENGKMTENNVWNFVAKYSTDFSDNQPESVETVTE